jgi:Asp-tRNA(Asn)/Glu-tRNA(Gln) amidotransferase A subunit family amidase
MELWRLTAAQASRLMAAGQLTSEQYTRALLERIRERDPTIRAWAWVDEDHALRQARERDREPRRGPLHGIPFGAKDVLNTRDIPTQHNSPIYAGHQPTEDANCVAVLRASGGVLLGKTETLEFASGGRMPISRNPHNPKHTPGGSSSGSGAAVGDCMVPIALGTQTGGSTIRPASFCGAYGMKPTFGRIGFEGAKHYSPQLDTIGLFGRSAEDLWITAQAFRLVPEGEPGACDIAGLRIGLCETPMWKDATPDGQKALHLAGQMLAQQGAKVVPLVLSEPFARLTEQQDIMMHEAGRGAFLPEYLSFGPLLHQEFRDKVENKKGFTGPQMREVFDQVALRRIDFEREFGELDAVMTLSTPGEAPLGIQSTGEAVFNRTFTALHVPCVTIPGLRGPTGLPIGIQFIQRRYEDEKLLRVACAVAAVLDPDARSRD